MAIIGFDFGTTNSLISYVVGARAVNLLDRQEQPIPSLICFEGSTVILGRDAKERVSRAGLGIHENIVRSPKRYLGKESIFVDGLQKSPVDIVSKVLKNIINLAKVKATGIKFEGAVVTIPVDMHGYQRRALRDAFKMAGLPIVQFVHEPLAALYGYYRSHDYAAVQRRYDRQLILVFDWGGGTLDLTLCRPTDGMVVQIMNDGTDEVGGDIFDETIMNRVLQLVMSRKGFGETTGIHLGAKARLLDKCERAKIDLSALGEVNLFLPTFFMGTPDDSLEYRLSQVELEEIVAPLLEKGFHRIEQILEKAGYSCSQVALCLATGGMSNMPAVKKRLHELFGPQRVEVPSTSATLIAEGAAWVASDKAGLQLAKNVELQLARNSYLPLIHAGTRMPGEGKTSSSNFHLYCTDPRDGQAKFEILTPRSAGYPVLPGEPRSILGTMAVTVDRKARAFQERIELQVSINDDLILEATAKSMNMNYRAQCEIHNLEFGLQLPATPTQPPHLAPPKVDDSTLAEPTEKGTLSIRSNLSNKIDNSLIPGELFYAENSQQFDPRFRNGATKLQVDEHLYYAPCSICGLSSNSPGCKC